MWFRIPLKSLPRFKTTLCSLSELILSLYSTLFGFSDALVLGIKAINNCHYAKSFISGFEVNCIQFNSTSLKLRIPPIAVILALWDDCQGLTLCPLLTPTADTVYCDTVLIACHETTQFVLCDTASGDVQKFPIWALRRVGSNVDEVEISTVSTTQCPAHSDIHSSTDISREVNTGEGGHRGGT